MYNLTVFKEVAIARWRKDLETGATFADGYLVFAKEVELPFVPAVGLQLQSDNWLPGPLTQVRYIIERQKFVAFVHEDNDIPDGLSRMLGDFSEDEMDSWVAREADSKKRLYQDLGWTLYNGQG